MKNLNKTILFASLIVAMILPFSGMMMADAAPNENANDKAKDRFNYEVEILEKTQTSQKYVDGVQVTTFTTTVKQTEFPTVQDFKEMNKEYFKSLDIETQNQRISEFETRMANAPEVYEIQTTKIGEHSITSEWFSRSLPSTWGAIKDPVNLIFYGNGNSGNADSVVDNYASHGWKDATGGPQWVFVDETSHSGVAYWSFSWDQLEEGDYYGTRYHLRIFNGGDSAHDSFDKWSLGAVHKETWNSGNNNHDLASNTWEISESHLKGDLTGATGVVSIGYIWLPNSGPYQGEPNNGLARLVELS